MILSSSVSIPVGETAMPGYLARPADEGTYPGVIVLEGVYGFDDELKRITDLVASFRCVGLAINYFHRTDPNFVQPYGPEGFAAGETATKNVHRGDVLADVAAARDWLNRQRFVNNGHVATWGFGFGGTVAYVTATLAGIDAAIVFYGQSIASLMPSGEAAPIEDTKEIRAPLLLVFGGQDRLISERDIEMIQSDLRSYNKKFEVQIYPNVGHSFFRTTTDTSSTREAADAWDRVQSFFTKYLR